MILDKLENAHLYSTISNNLKKGFDYLLTTDLKALSPGKYEIVGMDVFSLVSEFTTKEVQECKLEAHQLYADIQYIVSGREAIGYALLNDQEVLIPYQSEKDIIFFKGETFPLILEQGMFVVFFPHDVHQPGMQIDGPEEVKKVVVKVKI